MLAWYCRSADSGPFVMKFGCDACASYCWGASSCCDVALVVEARESGRCVLRADIDVLDRCREVIFRYDTVEYVCCVLLVGCQQCSLRSCWTTTTIRATIIAATLTYLSKPGRALSSYLYSLRRVSPQMPGATVCRTQTARRERT